MPEIFIITGAMLALLILAVIRTVLLMSIRAHLKNFMAVTEAQFDAVLSRIDTGTNAVAARIRSLEDAIRNQGLTPEQEEALLARTTGLADALEAIGKDPNNPVPIDPEGPAERETGDEA